jgi:hypothetical protein
MLLAGVTTTVFMLPVTAQLFQNVASSFGIVAPVESIWDRWGDGSFVSQRNPMIVVSLAALTIGIKKGAKIRRRMNTDLPLKCFGRLKVIFFICV